jgi:hypothetical protein
MYRWDYREKEIVCFFGYGVESWLLACCKGYMKYWEMRDEELVIGAGK